MHLRVHHPTNCARKNFKRNNRRTKNKGSRLGPLETSPTDSITYVGSYSLTSTSAVGTEPITPSQLGWSTDRVYKLSSVDFEVSCPPGSTTTQRFQAVIEAPSGTGNNISPVYAISGTTRFRIKCPRITDWSTYSSATEALVQMRYQGTFAVRVYVRYARRSNSDSLLV